MTEHTGLPVAGYKPQSAENVAVVNANKELEERVLRQIDRMTDVRGGDGPYVPPTGHDQRMVALARTKVQEAFMWLNRAVFQPGRVKLPEDPSS